MLHIKLYLPWTNVHRRSHTIRRPCGPFIERAKTGLGHFDRPTELEVLATAPFFCHRLEFRAPKPYSNCLIVRISSTWRLNWLAEPKGQANKGQANKGWKGQSGIHELTEELENNQPVEWRTRDSRRY